MPRDSDNESDEPFRRIEFTLGAYFAQVEIPDLIDDTTIVNTKLGMPAFENEDGYMLRADFNIPFGKTGALCLASKYYLGTESYNPWSLRLGITVNVDGLLKMFDYSSD